MMKSLRVAMFLALKSVVRGNIGVILLTILMLVLVTMNLLFVPGLIRGATNSMNDVLVKTYSGEIIIKAAGDDESISHADQLIRAIESVPGVAGVSARNSINAYITFEKERASCTINGIDPERDKTVFDVWKSVVEGSYLEPRDRQEILLGIQVAGNDRTDLELYSSSLRHVHAGDKVLVSYSNGCERQYTVKGIFDTEFIQTDLQAFISDVEFTSIMPAMDNRATSVRVKLEEGADPQWVMQRIATMRSGLEFETWEQTAGLVKSFTESFDLINKILNVVNYLVAGITVFIVTYIDVTNRRRQIGIQRAIGIKSHSITLSYLIRALFYALVAIAIGVLVFIYVVIPFEARHPFSFPFGAAYLTIEFHSALRLGTILLVVALVAAFIPAWRTIRIKILDAIWG